MNKDRIKWLEGKGKGWAGSGPSGQYLYQAKSLAAENGTICWFQRAGSVHYIPGGKN